MAWLGTALLVLALVNALTVRPREETGGARIRDEHQTPVGNPDQKSPINNSRSAIRNRQSAIYWRPCFEHQCCRRSRSRRACRADRSQPVHGHRAMGSASGGADVGLDERHRRRTERPHLGRRTLRRKHLRRIESAAILEFDPSGKLLRSFAAGMFVFPHGFLVDREGNVWVTDAQGTRRQRPSGLQVQPGRASSC